MDNDGDQIELVSYALYSSWKSFSNAYTDARFSTDTVDVHVADSGTVDTYYKRSSSSCPPLVYPVFYKDRILPHRLTPIRPSSIRCRVSTSAVVR